MGGTADFHCQFQCRDICLQERRAHLPIQPLENFCKHQMKIGWKQQIHRSSHIMSSWFFISAFEIRWSQTARHCGRGAAAARLNVAASPASAATGHGLWPPGDGRLQWQFTRESWATMQGTRCTMLATYWERDGKHVFDVPAMSARCRQIWRVLALNFFKV